MFDKEAIQELTMAQAITSATEAVNKAVGASVGAVALPSDFKIHDLEKFLEIRRNMRGSMDTNSLESFADYVNRSFDLGSMLFVDGDNMQAVAILDLGTAENPGHQQHTARLSFTPTAALKALRAIANGNAISQTKLAEFLEDWSPAIGCYDSDSIMLPTSKAVHAARTVTIESMRKLEVSEQSLGASRSAFESIQAAGTNKPPVKIVFTCVPYAGLEIRAFDVRVGLVTTGDKPNFVLRIVNEEMHREEMACEAVQLVRGRVSAPVMVGVFTSR